MKEWWFAMTARTVITVSSQHHAARHTQLHDVEVMHRQSCRVDSLSTHKYVGRMSLSPSRRVAVRS